MLTKVEIRNTLGELLTLDLTTTSDGLIVQDIRGLEPGKATVSSSSFANLDGAVYQSSRFEFRNIVFVLGLEPDYIATSVQDLRFNLYKFFMPKTPIQMKFFVGDLHLDIAARVEAFDAPLFTKEPVATLSVLCFDPNFISEDTTLIEGDTVADSTEFLVDYAGTVPTGAIFKLMVDRTLTEFTIYHRPADDLVRTLDFAAALAADDLLTINSNKGSKAVTLTRVSVDSSLLYGMSPQSTWLELLPGPNYIRVYAEGAAIPFTIEYMDRYGGL